MTTANSKQARYDIDELQAALDAEAKLRLELEERLRQTQEDFQEFILSAAHDLREPLRTVNAYCELLTLPDAQRGDSEADQFRRYISEATARIQALVSGMGEYAMASADSHYVLRTDVTAVLREAMAVSAASTSMPAPVITHDSLPAVRGDFERLVKVFRHLFDNASKYCGNVEPRIHVSAHRDGSDWVFAVQDNGPGIDHTYHERIFRPFKRLHGRQFAGVGLGLAFCQRAIESHGGRMWVESSPGNGATFCFTLPAAD